MIDTHRIDCVLRIIENIFIILYITTCTYVHVCVQGLYQQIQEIMLLFVIIYYNLSYT